MRAFLFSLAHQAGRRGWLLGLLLLALAALRPEAARATHIRAGDIQSKVDTTAAHNPNRIFFKMTLFCNPASSVKQENVDILFGDGSRGNFPKAQTINVNPQVVIYTYYFDHIFPGPNARGYLVEFVGENRVDNILNINGGNSVNVTFYINTRVFPDPSLGLNHSAVLRAPAYDQGAIKQVFLHNPAVYDADGDSVTVTPKECQQVQNGLPMNATSVMPTIVPGYVYPNSPSVPNAGANATQIPFPGIPAGNPANTSTAGGGAAIYTQDLHTGQIVWNAPAVAGFYNVAMEVLEFRRVPGAKPRLIGRVIRDMQIIIQATQNLPPIITVPPDICVQAGQQVQFNVSAIDQTGPGTAGAPTPVTLFAYAGIIPPATFVQNNTGISVTGTFKWTPDCSNVSDQPYLVLFKAQDSPPITAGNPLIDERPVRITVVGPPPQNLKATTSGTTAILSWDKYTCQNASQILIFRRDTGCYPYTPGPCDTGLPASAGYHQVGSVAPSVTTFADAPLVRGTSYSYRIYAVFPLPAGGTSIVSNEACLRLTGRSVLLTNVDVQATSTTAGRIGVKWTKPRSNNGDTLFTKPYGYRLSRATSAAGPFTLIATKANRVNDTTFVDTGINTDAQQFFYKLEFYQTVATSSGNTEQVDPAVTGSSVRTTLQPDGVNNTITVNFGYTVPWDNSKLPAKIFRRTGTTGTYAQIGTVTPGATSGTYLDKDPTLQRGQQYCYYVQTAGQYADYLSFLNNLLNNSQEICAVLRPTPCTPVLTLRPINCDSLAASTNYFPEKQTYRNQLTWTVGTTPAGCTVDAAYYRIFRATSTAGPFVLLDSTRTTSYLNGPLTQQNYCYQVQAVSAAGERSALSNIACQNECVFFILPNIFIPGSNVEANRLFRPKTSSPITRTHIQIFNRWGRKVYESDADPYINWSGGGVDGESTTSSLVSDGIYYYLAEVEFADSNHTKKVYKGWVEKH